MDMQKESIVLIAIVVWIYSSVAETGITFNTVRRVFTKANQSCTLHKMDLVRYGNNLHVYLDKPEYKSIPASGRFWLGNNEFDYKPVCSHHWVYNPATKSCYRVFLNNTTLFNDAENSCIRNDARLTNIENKEEQYFLRELINAQTSGGTKWDSLWTAGKDNEQEGLWKWSQYDQYFAHDLEWVEGQPDEDTTNEEDCAALVIDNYENYGYLNDDSCYLPAKNRGYICKKTGMGLPATRRYAYMRISDGKGTYHITANTTLKMGYVCEHDSSSSTQTEMTPTAMTSSSDNSSSTSVNSSTGKPRPPIVIDKDASVAMIAIGIGIMIPVLIISVCLTFFLVRRKYIKPNSAPSISMSHLQNANRSQSNQRVYTKLALSEQRHQNDAYDPLMAPHHKTDGAVKSSEGYTELFPPGQRGTGISYTGLCQNGSTDDTIHTQSTEEDTYYSACV